MYISGKRREILVMVLPLNFSRKMDASGRYVIPAQIRKEFGVETDIEHELFLISSDGTFYLGFEVEPSQVYLDYLKKFSSII
jgi:bifunctional DNA-binding transcriptional regulator/antitoxin component of YhaV-PrlF toxin-antitoxin module